MLVRNQPKFLQLDVGDKPGETSGMVRLSDLLKGYSPPTNEERAYELEVKHREYIREHAINHYHRHKQRYIKYAAEYKKKWDKKKREELVEIKDNNLNTVRVKRKNLKKRIKYYQELRRQEIMANPIDYSDVPQEENIPKNINRPIQVSSLDVEPRWRAADPRKRMSWPEFCRDFIEQNFGSIAQSMLELFQVDKQQFMKFIIEMGKQGNPQAMQLDVNANVKRTSDIYAVFQSMASMSAMPGKDQPQLPQKQDIFGQLAEMSEAAKNNEEQEVCTATDPDQCFNCDKFTECGLPMAHYATELCKVDISTTQEEKAAQIENLNIEEE